MTASAQAPPWPTGRSTRSALVAQFGDARAELVGWALATGDPLADAVVAEIHEHRAAVQVALRDGIANGLASLVDPPPAVAALLRDAETIPDYVDDDLLDHGAEAYFDAPAAAHVISLSAGSLVRVYDSPSIVNLLATTGWLTDGAPRRLLETGRWVNSVMLPGALRVGGAGYVATLQVRMLHAHVRAHAGRVGYDEAAYGVPINQLDLARTWMDFTLTSFRAEALMGFDLTPAEVRRLYRVWWLVAHQLGVDRALVEGISSNEEAKRADDLFQTVTEPPAEESAELAKASLAAIAATLHEVTSIPECLGLPALHALTRRFHGDAMADGLGLPRAGVADAVLRPAIAAVRTARARRRRDPAAWAALRRKNHGVAAELASGTDETTYQHGT